MASIPGFRFDITGASGSQGLLGPKNSWRAYILPRGAYASQDSTGTLLTVDSADAANRFASNVWIQVGLSTASIRQVNVVDGDSFSISGAALTVSENDRIFLIGNTQPTVTGGSATYTTPDTVIRRRDDDAGSTYSNSMITSDSNGLIQGFAETNFYDAIIQDGNQSNQGSLIDMSVGVVEGVSVSGAALFGATVTVNGQLGVTGWATFGSTVTMNAALGVTGHAVFGVTITGHANFGITGHATIGGSASIGTSLSVLGTFSAVMPRVRVYFDNPFTTGNSFTTATGASNIVTWADVLYDVGDMFASGSSSLITVPEDGVYALNAGIQYANNATGHRFCRIANGTSQVSIADSMLEPQSDATADIVQAAAVIYAISGTTFYVSAFQNSGSSITIGGDTSVESTFFSAHKLS